MAKDVLLVGSVPFDSVEEVFRSFGKPLGDALVTMPDGEVGPRRHWISRVHYQVLSGHAELETVRRPQPENGVERLNPRNAADSWLFKVRDGVDRVRFGEPGWRLGYARDAINSYFVFKTLRENGELAGHLRFQVSLPSVNSALPPRIFPDQKDIAKVRPGYQDALAAEIGTIVSKIPPKDLAIQWDCATEVQDAYGAVPGYPAEGGVERSLDQFRKLSPLVPSDALLGYHFCFGTLGGWPRFAPKTCRPRSSSPTPPSRRPAAGSTGSTSRSLTPPTTHSSRRSRSFGREAPRSISASSTIWRALPRASRRRARCCRISGWRAIAASAAFRRATCLPC